MAEAAEETAVEATLTVVNPLAAAAVEAVLPEAIVVVALLEIVVVVPPEETVVVAHSAATVVDSEAIAAAVLIEATVVASKAIVVVEVVVLAVDVEEASRSHTTLALLATAFSSKAMSLSRIRQSKLSKTFALRALLAKSLTTSSPDVLAMVPKVYRSCCVPTIYA